ncbi:MAG: molybdopterin-binding protein, partial [Actinomycetota bacterium]|nr:molybdopterin-binding protein [Actinomycetota bacterium]
GLYGYISATKWIVDMELTTFEKQTAYWVQEPRSWGRFGPIKTMSRIDSPGSFERVPADQVTCAGIAWAQPIGIERIEVRVDGGAWMPAELSTEVNTDTWRMWKLPVPGLQPGLHTAEVRATDKSGYTQTSERVMPIPDGATGWHTIRFNVL